MVVLLVDEFVLINVISLIHADTCSGFLLQVT